MKENELEQYGKKCSYLFYSFIKWIIDDWKKNEINDIYFFTREGEFYKEIAGPNCEIIFGNKAECILDYTKYVINADIHTRKQTKAHLLKCGAKKVVSLDEILTKSVNGDRKSVV